MMIDILSSFSQDIFYIYYIIVCLIVSILIIIIELIYYFYLIIKVKTVFYYDDSKIKKKIKNTKIKLLVWLCFGIVNIVFANLSIRNTKHEITIDDTNSANNSVNNSEIKFFTIENNEEYTVWDQLLLNDLKYSFFESEIEFASENQDIIGDYHGETTNYLLSQQKNIDEIDSMITNFEGLLPEVEMTLNEINDIINSYDDKSKVPVEIYMQELALRIEMTKNNLTKDNAYQTGRAAHDVVKGISSDGLVCNKELLFFSALSFDFYILSIPLQEGEISNEYILYRCGMLFLDLADCKEFTQEMEEKQKSNYLQHFYLMAEAFFSQIIETDIETLISEGIDHMYYYYGFTIYRLVQKYKYENIAPIAITYLQEYKELPGKIIKSNYVEQCEYMIKYLQ